MAIWPFGRRRNADEPTPEPADADSASPATGEADVARPDRVPTGDWMTVPPVRTSMTPAMPTTFRVQTLPEILTSHQDSRLSGSLGHAVSSDAPSGVIGGLARPTSSLGTVSHEGTVGAPPVLHEPAHPAKPEPPAPPLQRRLTPSTEAPLAVSSPDSIGTMAPPAPALPEPAVSRVLASPGAMPSPASLGANPLPVARVVDTAPAAPRSSGPSTAAASSPAAAADAPARADGPAASDDRVGGFEVDLTTLLGGPGAADDLPVITPPPDLAPPIQRSVRRDPTPPTLRSPVQRAADRTTPTPPPSMPTITPGPPSPASSDAPTERGSADPAEGPADPAASSGPATPSGGELPPIQRLGTPGSAPGTSASGTREGGTGVPDAEAPTADRPTIGGDPLGRVADTSRSSAGDAAPAAPGDGPDLTLAAPPVQRSADAGTDAPAEHFPGDGHDHGDGDSAVQRSAEAATTPSVPPSGTDAARRDSAPVAGDDPLEPVSAGGPLVDEPAEDGSTATGTAEDLPLVARSAEPAAPTLGAEGADGPRVLPLQTLSDTVQTHTDGGTSALPLAPPEQPGTILPPAAPPAPGDSARSAGLVGDGPAPTVSGRASGSPTSPVTTAGAGPMPARPLVAQRQATPSAGPSAGPSPTSTTASAPALRPLASSAGSLLLASPSSTGPGGEASPASMTVLGAPPADAPAVPLQRSFDDDGFAAASPSDPSASAPVAGAPPAGDSRPLARASAGAGGTAGSTATPTTSLVAQRAVEGTAGATARAPMPLHTAAAAVPTTTDLLVKAGLGEKGPDGSFLRSTPPPGVESSFTVQTLPEAAGATGAAPVQRAVRVDEISTSVPGSGAGGAGGGGGGGGATSEADIRKLYEKLRAELEADLRRQLEAKSRYNRYRP